MTSTATAVTEASAVTGGTVALAAVAATVDRGNPMVLAAHTVVALAVHADQDYTVADPGASAATDIEAGTSASADRGNTAATDIESGTAAFTDRSNTAAPDALTVLADQNGTAALNADEILAGHAQSNGHTQSNVPAKWKSKTKAAVRRPVLWPPSKGSAQGSERIPCRCSLEWSLTAHQRRRRRTY